MMFAGGFRATTVKRFEGPDFCFDSLLPLLGNKVSILAKYFALG